MALTAFAVQTIPSGDVISRFVVENPVSPQRATMIFFSGDQTPQDQELVFGETRSVQLSIPVTLVIIRRSPNATNPMVVLHQNTYDHNEVSLNMVDVILVHVIAFVLYIKPFGAIAINNDNSGDQHMDDHLTGPFAGVDLGVQSIPFGLVTIVQV